MRFFSYYSARGWKIRDEPMTSWRAMCDNWQENDNRRKIEAAREELARTGVLLATKERITGHGEWNLD